MDLRSPLAFLFMAFMLHATQGMAQQDTTNQRVNGKREGYWMKHRGNGTPKWEGHYVNGRRMGHWKLYNKEGTLHSEGEMVDGERMGAWYLVNTATGTKLDMTRWDGKGHCVGGATLSW